MTGEQLRRLRLRRGWTQVQMARKLGLSRNGLSNYERDVREIPRSVAGYARCLVEHLAEQPNRGR